MFAIIAYACAKFAVFPPEAFKAAMTVRPHSALFAPAEPKGSVNYPGLLLPCQVLDAVDWGVGEQPPSAFVEPPRGDVRPGEVVEPAARLTGRQSAHGVSA